VAKINNLFLNFYHLPFIYWIAIPKIIFDMLIARFSHLLINAKII
jgi:hypothetical protein